MFSWNKSWLTTSKKIAQSVPPERNIIYLKSFYLENVPLEHTLYNF